MVRGTLLSLLGYLRISVGSVGEGLWSVWSGLLTCCPFLCEAYLDILRHTSWDLPSTDI